jgi:hypothetical protein
VRHRDQHRRRLRALSGKLKAGCLGPKLIADASKFIEDSSSFHRRLLLFLLTWL